MLLLPCLRDVRARNLAFALQGEDLVCITLGNTVEKKYVALFF